MRALLAIGLLAAASAGCFNSPKNPCVFLCGTGNSCPDGYQCATADNRCHLVLEGGGLAQCTEPLPADAAAVADAPPATPDAAAVDAPPSTPDATVIDAPVDAQVIDAPVDAMVIDAPAIDAPAIDAPAIDAPVDAM